MNIKRLRIKVYVLTLLLHAIGITYIYSQEQLNIQAAASVNGYKGEIMPLWQYSNQWGMYRFNDSSPGFQFYLSGNYQLIEKQWSSVNVGLGAISNNQNSKPILHELFVKGQLFFIDYSIGKEAFSPLIYDDELTSGMFLGSSNARPMPRISLGIYNYLTVPFTREWLQVKGGISHGWLNDDRGKLGNSDVLFHEKFIYFRLGKLPIKPYAGIIHNALFGGTRPGGSEIPVDFWPTFFGQGSAKIGGGDETNVAGAHMGLFDFGFDFSLNGINGHFYLQKPFADGSGMRIDKEFLKDRIVGVVLNWPGKRLLSGISLEYVKTDWQSGPGTPDPIDPESDTIVFANKITDVDAYMHQRFPDEEVEGWSKDDLFTYLENEWNHGYRFGGRDDYYCNGMYKRGWSYDGMVLGSPLSLSAAQMLLVSNGENTANHDNYIVNNRIRAFNISLYGLLGSLKYRIKYTISQNYGAYGEEYQSRYSWDKVDNYYFEHKKNQSYSMFELEKRLGLIDLSANIGYDFGDMYQSFGANISMRYQFSQ